MKSYRYFQIIHLGIIIFVSLIVSRTGSFDISELMANKQSERMVYRLDNYLHFSKQKISAGNKSPGKYYGLQLVQNLLNELIKP